MLPALTTIAWAQNPMIPRGCENPGDTGVVTGQVLDRTTGDPSSHHFVSLHPERVNWTCVTLLDSVGRFAISNVPPGNYRLVVSEQRDATAIELAVDRDTVHLIVEVEPVDVVAMCEAEVDCRPVLKPIRLSQSSPDISALDEVGYRTTIAVALTMAGVATDWVPCVDAADSILRALRSRIPDVVPMAECEMREVPSGPPDKRLVHTPSGRLAYAVGFKPLERSDRYAKGVASISVASLWGYIWHCFYENRDLGWELEWCSLRVVS